MTAREPLRTLIVEDDPVVARSIARRLLRDGYTVTLASSCRAARAAGKGFLSAVLDLDLPDGSGAELADAVLRDGAVQSVVFYTGSMDADLRTRAASYGPVIDKSDDLDEIVRALEPQRSVPPVSTFAPAPRSRTTHARVSRLEASDDASLFDFDRLAPTASSAR
jgi:CheY-like chemotaxis protein